MPLAGGIALLAPRLVETLYGISFEGTGLALQLIVLALPLLCLNDIVSYLLMSADKAQNVLRIVGIGAALNAILNIIFISRWGYMGAAAATCLTTIFLFIIYFNTINQLWGPSGLVSHIWKPGIASLVMLVLLQGFFSFLDGLT